MMFKSSTWGFLMVAMTINSFEAAIFGRQILGGISTAMTIVFMLEMMITSRQEARRDRKRDQTITYVQNLNRF
jgi:hypothetical protein